MSDQQDIETGNEQAQDFFQSDQFDDVVAQQTEHHDFPDDFDDLPPEDRADDTDGDDPPPDDDSDDTEGPFEDPDFYDEDSDEDDDDDDEDEEDEDEFEEDEEDEEDDDEDQKGFTPKQQTRFTQRMQELSQLEEELVEREKFAKNVQETVGDRKLFAGMMKKVMEGDSRIAEAAFNAVADGDQAEEFVLQVALKRQAMFEKVRTRYDDLTGDEDAMKKYEETIALQAERRQVQEERVQLNRRRYQQDRAKVTSQAKRFARKMGIGKEDMFVVEEELDRGIRAKVSKKDGSIALDPADVKKLVKGAHSKLDRVYQRILNEQSKSKTETSQQKAKTRAKKAKRGRKASTPSQKTKGKATNKRRATRRTDRGSTQRQKDHDLMFNIDESARQAGVASRR